MPRYFEWQEGSGPNCNVSDVESWAEDLPWKPAAIAGGEPKDGPGAAEFWQCIMDKRLTGAGYEWSPKDNLAAEEIDTYTHRGGVAPGGVEANKELLKAQPGRGGEVTLAQVMQDNFSNWSAPQLGNFQKQGGLTSTGVTAGNPAYGYPVASYSFGEEPQDKVSLAYSLSEQRKIERGYKAIRGAESDFSDCYCNYYAHVSCSDGIPNGSGNGFGAWGLFGIEDEGIVSPLINYSDVGTSLPDLTTTTSVWGSTIPLIVGRGLVGTNLIWMSEVRRHTIAHRSRADDTATELSVTRLSALTADLVLSIGSGSIAGLLRVWINDQLVFDNVRGSSATALNALYAANQRADDKGVDLQLEAISSAVPPMKLALVKGEEFQPAVGSTNYPVSYRDQAYLLIENYLFFRNGGIPRVRVEVMSDGQEAVGSITQYENAAVKNVPTGEVVDNVGDGHVRYLSGQFQRVGSTWRDGEPIPAGYTVVGTNVYTITSSETYVGNKKITFLTGDKPALPNSGPRRISFSTFGDRVVYVPTASASRIIIAKISDSAVYTKLQFIDFPTGVVQDIWMDRVNTRVVVYFPSTQQTDVVVINHISLTIETNTRFNATLDWTALSSMGIIASVSVPERAMILISPDTGEIKSTGRGISAGLSPPFSSGYRLPTTPSQSVIAWRTVSGDLVVLDVHSMRHSVSTNTLISLSPQMWVNELNAITNGSTLWQLGQFVPYETTTETLLSKLGVTSLNPTPLGGAVITNVSSIPEVIRAAAVLEGSIIYEDNGQYFTSAKNETVNQVTDNDWDSHGLLFKLDGDRRAEVTHAAVTFYDIDGKENTSTVRGDLADTDTPQGFTTATVPFYLTNAQAEAFGYNAIASSHRTDTLPIVFGYSKSRFQIGDALEVNDQLWTIRSVEFDYMLGYKFELASSDYNLSNSLLPALNWQDYTSIDGPDNSDLDVIIVNTNAVVPPTSQQYSFMVTTKSVPIRIHGKTLTQLPIVGELISTPASPKGEYLKRQEDGVIVVGYLTPPDQSKFTVNLDEQRQEYGVNTLIVGEEIVLYGSVSWSIDGLTATFTNLMRGLRSTHPYMKHEVGEKVYLYDNNSFQSLYYDHIHSTDSLSARSRLYSFEVGGNRRIVQRTLSTKAALGLPSTQVINSRQQPFIDDLLSFAYVSESEGWTFNRSFPLGRFPAYYFSGLKGNPIGFRGGNVAYSVDPLLFSPDTFVQDYQNAVGNTVVTVASGLTIQKLIVPSQILSWLSPPHYDTTDVSQPSAASVGPFMADILNTPGNTSIRAITFCITSSIPAPGVPYALVTLSNPDIFDISKDSKETETLDPADDLFLRTSNILEAKRQVMHGFIAARIEDYGVLK